MYFDRREILFRVLNTLQEHTGRVFRLQFDEFQIVSSSHDDTILIWDFLNCNQENSGSDTSASGFRNNNLTVNLNQSDTRSPSRKYSFIHLLMFFQDKTLDTNLGFYFFQAIFE